MRNEEVSFFGLVATDPVVSKINGEKQMSFAINQDEGCIRHQDKWSRFKSNYKILVTGRNNLQKLENTPKGSYVHMEGRLKYKFNSKKDPWIIIDGKERYIGILKEENFS